MMKQGLVGGGVAAVQYALNGAARLAPDWREPPLVVDGIFGPRTFARLVDHQKRRGLTPDGVVGPLTLNALFTRAVLRSRVAVEMTASPRASAPTLAAHGFRAGAPRPDPLSLSPLRLGAPGLGTPGQARPGPRPYPDLSSWLSPSLAEMARHQAAFLEWWSKPHPKPPLPAPPAPAPAPWDRALEGWAFMARKRQVQVSGAPASTTKAVAHASGSGLELTAKIASEARFGPSPPEVKYYELEIELAGVLTTSRYGEFKLGVAGAQAVTHKGAGYEAKSALSLTQGRPDLWKSAGPWFSAAKLEMSAEIAAALALEAAMRAAEVEASAGAELQIAVYRGTGEEGLTLALGVRGGSTTRIPLWVRHPGREPDEEKVRISPFVDATVGLTWRFH